MQVGAAHYLAETRNFECTAVLIFKQGEESFARAKAMIDDCLFDHFLVQPLVERCLAEHEGRRVLLHAAGQAAGLPAPDRCHQHNSLHEFNDDILPLGAALHASLVEQGLSMTFP